MRGEYNVFFLRSGEGRVAPLMRIFHEKKITTTNNRHTRVMRASIRARRYD